MQILFKNIRLFLMIPFAVYATLAAGLLVTWAPTAFEGVTLHAFVVSVTFLILAMWIYVAYEMWKYRTKSKLGFADAISAIIDSIADWKRNGTKRLT